MDLSFARFEQDAQITVLPGDLAVLLVGVAARQAASPTALVQARIDRRPAGETLFAPAHGAFNFAVATLLADAADNFAATPVKAPFTDPLRPTASPGGYDRPTEEREGPPPQIEVARIP